MIRLDRVSKTYPSGDAPAVDSLSLEVAEGEIVVLVGPSGCGKTTTLKMINRLIEPTSGTIEVAGRDVGSMSPPELRRSIGYVIQQIGLFPHRTIAENVATVPRLLGWEKPRIDRRVDELLEVVDLDRSMRARYPAELSGGQRQRVGVARALAADPQVMLMDEPFGAVDPIARGRLQDQFLELQQRVHKTIVMVTHDIDEAVKLGDRIALLNVGGVLEQYDTPAELLASPANEFVVDFLGSERGLKRLSLMPIGTLPLEAGPVLPATASVEDARRVMADYGVDWIAVGGEGRLDGWVPAAELDDRHDLGGLPLRRFHSWLTVDASLIEALDVIVSSNTSVAAVFDGDRYLGMLTAEAVARACVQ